jgi:hypothetical protein
MDPRQALPDALPDTPIWRESVAAVRRYRDRPSAQSIFPVFDAPSAQPELWNAHNRGGVQERGSSLEPFRQFEAAMLGQDRRAAETLALSAATRLARPDERLAARLAFAARAMLVHRAADVADRIVTANRTADEWPQDAALDQFLLRMRCRTQSDANAHLLERIITSGHEHAATAACEWMAFRWRFESATPDVLDENLTLARRLESDTRLMQECLSQAFVLDSKAAAAILNEHPSLAKHYKTLLPLAVHLREHSGGGAIDVDDVRKHAALFDDIEDASRALNALVSNQAASLAIVGNSPCERGTGAGARIDAHDTVARFNYFATGPQHSRDYGERFTIHVRSPRADAALDAASARARLTVLCQGDLLYAVRHWRHAFSLRDQGIALACLPKGSNDALRKSLHAEPSLGLAFLAYVKAMRGVLPRGDCFGFSFTDQIGPNASPAHYFDDKAPALTHQWTSERVIFDAMVT